VFYYPLVLVFLLVAFGWLMHTFAAH